MRDIKFRAWDERRRELVYFDLNLCNDESRSWYNQQIDGNHIMQYTGLKDKNGVEIYEGDVVYDHACKSTTIVEYNEIISEENFGDGIGFIGYNLDLYYGYPPTHAILEVIGNIYENPELLEAK